MLPLHDNAALIGKALMFVDPDWQPDPVEYEFMEDLAQALSVLVSRLIINETLRVREVELEDARTDAIRRLGTASEYRDNETGMHIMRMTHIATAIAKAMDLPPEQRELLAICAPMHDVGKIGIPDAILLKPGRLLPDEYEVMKGHTSIGKRLLEGDDMLIQAARDIAASHHEHWDGNGYPEGLAGEDIPLLAAGWLAFNAGGHTPGMRNVLPVPGVALVGVVDTDGERARAVAAEARCAAYTDPEALLGQVDAVLQARAPAGQDAQSHPVALALPVGHLADVGRRRVGHVQDGRGRVAGRIRQQPGNCLSHLFWLRRTPHGQRRGHALGTVRLAARGVDARIGDAGPHCHHAHAFGRHLSCQPLREHVDGPLGGGVVDIHRR